MDIQSYKLAIFGLLVAVVGLLVGLAIAKKRLSQALGLQHPQSVELNRQSNVASMRQMRLKTVLQRFLRMLNPY